MNKKIKVNTNDIPYSGTCLQGYVVTTYDKIVEVLGEPITDIEKSTAHWNIQAPDGTVATIYDWKEWMTPVGEYEWHIGGHGPKALLLVEFILGLKPRVYGNDITGEIALATA